MPQVVCIIQARRQSERLPDKTLLELSGRKVLTRVINRCQKIGGVNNVIVAAPKGAYEDPIENVARSAGADCFRGDMRDVLSRFYYAAKPTKADYIMRVTADCPLLDPVICKALLDKLLDNSADYGATANWPHGLDCEVFSWRLLEQAHHNATALADREHVTLWMKRKPDIKSVSMLPENGNLHIGNRWVVDYPEDYEFLTSLFAHFPEHEDNISWKDILEIVDRNPELRAINAKCANEWGLKNERIYKSVGHHWKSPC